MTLAEILVDKTLKGKSKTEVISKQLLDGTFSVNELVKHAAQLKESAKATCIEALEYATKLQPEIATPEVLTLAVNSLADKAPRVKWESAKVIGNMAHRFPDLLDEAVTQLLNNTEHTGTVVRWSAAFALCEITKLEHPRSSELLPALEAISNREEKASIKKIYQVVLKELKK